MQPWLISINKGGKIDVSPFLMLTKLHKIKCVAGIFTARWMKNRCTH